MLNFKGMFIIELAGLIDKCIKLLTKRLYRRLASIRGEEARTPHDLTYSIKFLLFCASGGGRLDPIIFRIFNT